MDNQHDNGEGCKHNTASEEALHRLAHTVESLTKEYETTKFYQFRKRMFLRGMLEAMVLVVGLLDSLNMKYDNSRGTFN